MSLSSPLNPIRLRLLWILKKSLDRSLCFSKSKYDIFSDLNKSDETHIGVIRSLSRSQDLLFSDQILPIQIPKRPWVGLEYYFAILEFRQKSQYKYGVLTNKFGNLGDYDTPTEYPGIVYQGRYESLNTITRNPMIGAQEPVVTVVPIGSDSIRRFK